MDISERIALIVQQLRSVAQEGLYWSGERIHDERRYEAVMRAAAELAALDGAESAEALNLRFVREPGALSPYVGSEGAVVDDVSRLLLIRREDDGLWALPGGGSSIGESPADTAVRETFEEAGIRVRPDALIGIYDSRLCGTRASLHLYHLVFLCRPLNTGAPVAGPETTDVDWFHEGDLPNLSPGHAKRIADVFAFAHGERRSTFFDGEPSGVESTREPRFLER